MKKALLILSFMCLEATCSNILAADIVPLQSQKIRPTDEHTKPSRSPMRLPLIYIEDHILLFSDSFVGFEVTILQNGQVVYMDCVGADGTLMLPENMSGDYELQIIIGDYIVTGTFNM